MMNNQKLISKLIYAFMFMALLLLIGGVVGYTGISQVSGDLSSFTKNRFPAIHSLSAISESQQTIGSIEKFLLMPEFETNVAEKKALYKSLDEAWEHAETGWTTYASLPHSKEAVAILNKLKPAWEAWKKGHTDVMQKLKEGNRQEASAIAAGSVGEAFKTTEQLLRDLSDLNLQQAGSAKNTGYAKAFWLKIFAAGGTIAGIMLALALGIFFAGIISNQIKSFVTHLKESSDQFASASAQIEISSQQLAAGTSDQASVVEEAYAVIEDLTAANRKHDEQIRLLKVKTDEAQLIRNEATERIGESVKAMEAIKKLSEDTSSVVKNIETIAFQTNLLALNASVEAARAGDVGSGFAVVADEVRNLAIRASQAAENTNNLIDETVQAVYKGADLVSKSLSTFQEYGDTANNFGQFMNLALEMSHDEARGFEKINQSMNQINKVVQENAACAEETAAAAEEMNAQSDAMKQSVTLLATVVDKKEDSSQDIHHTNNVRGEYLLPADENHPYSLIPMNSGEVKS